MSIPALLTNRRAHIALWAALYIVSYLSHTSVSAMTGVLALSGCVLTFYYPGRTALERLNISGHPVSLFGASVLFSWGIWSTLLVAEKILFGFTDKGYLILLAATVAGTLLLTKNTPRKAGTPLLAPLSIALALPILFFIIRVLINPYIADQDGEKYIYIFEKIREFGFDGSFLSAQRTLFAPLVMSLHTITGVSFIWLMKGILPALTWIGLCGLPVFIPGERKHTWLITLLLVSPAFVGHIDRFKPETAALLFNALTLGLFWLFSKTRSPGYILAALAATIIATRYHETAFLTLMSLGIALALLAVSQWKNIAPYFSKRNIFFATIIALPYLILIKPTLVLSSFINTLRGIAGTSSLAFKPWFLNDLTSAGMNISWHGWTFLIYYIFNGIAIIALAAVLWHNVKREKKSLAPLYPALVAGTLYLLLAEVLPRANINILPDRAMNQLFFFSTCIVMYVYVSGAVQLSKIIKSLIILNIVLASVVSFTLSYSAGDMASRREAPGLAAIIEKTEKDAIILSDQALNSASIELYTSRDFVPVGSDLFTTTTPTTYAELKQVLNQALTENRITYTNRVFPETKVRINNQSQATTQTNYGNLFVLSHTEQQRPNTKEVQIAQPAYISSGTPVYFYHSFVKSEGLLSKTRDYATSILKNDFNTILHSASSAGVPEIIYSDSSTILLRVR